MANQLKMAKIQTILALHERGWSYRRIGRELGIRHETVSRHVRMAEAASKAANAPPGSSSNAAKAPSGSGESKPAKAPLGSEVRSGACGGPPEESESASVPLMTEVPESCSPVAGGRRSDCEPYRDQIQAKLDQGL